MHAVVASVAGRWRPALVHGTIDTATVRSEGGAEAFNAAAALASKALTDAGAPHAMLAWTWSTSIVSDQAPTPFLVNAPSSPLEAVFVVETARLRDAWFRGVAAPPSEVSARVRIAATAAALDADGRVVGTATFSPYYSESLPVPVAIPDAEGAIAVDVTAPLPPPPPPTAPSVQTPALAVAPTRPAVAADEVEMFGLVPLRPSLFINVTVALIAVALYYAPTISP